MTAIQFADNKIAVMTWHFSNLFAVILYFSMVQECPMDKQNGRLKAVNERLVPIFSSVISLT